MTYWLSLKLVLACAGKMLFLFSPGLALWLAIVTLIKYVSPDRITSRAQKGRNL